MLKKLRIKSFFAIITFLSFLVFSGNVQIDNLRAATPATLLTYQGRLFSADDVPVSDASISMLFEIYDASTAGNCVWSNSSSTCASSSARTVNLRDNGRFTEALGDTSATPAYAAINSSIFEDNSELYLEVTVAGETLSPRKRITSSPYAINTATLEGMAANEFVQVVGGCDNCLDWSSFEQEMTLDGAASTITPLGGLPVGVTAVQGENEFLVFDLADDDASASAPSNVSGFLINLDSNTFDDANPSFSQFTISAGEKYSAYGGDAAIGALAGTLLQVTPNGGVLIPVSEANNLLSLGSDLADFGGSSTGLSTQTGIRVSADDLSSGTGIEISQGNDSDSAFTGKFIDLNQALSAAGSSSEGNFIYINSNNDSSITDTSTLLELIQGNNNSSGDVISVNQSGDGSVFSAASSNDNNSSNPFFDLDIDSSAFTGEGFRLQYSGAGNALYIDGVRDSATTSSAVSVNDEVNGYLVTLNNVDDGTASDDYQGISLTACGESATFDCDFITFLDGDGDEVGGISGGGYGGSGGISFNSSNKGVSHFFAGDVTGFSNGQVVKWSSVTGLEVVDSVSDTPVGVYSDNVAFGAGWDASETDSDNLVPVVSYGVVDALVTDDAGVVAIGNHLTINSSGQFELAGQGDDIYATALESYDGGSADLVEVFLLPAETVDKTYYNSNLAFMEDGSGFTTVVVDGDTGGTPIFSNDIVSFSGTDLVQSDGTTGILGVATGDPGFVSNYTGQAEASAVAVTVSGMATIEVIKNNDQDISVGDYIGISSISNGYGEKLFGPGKVVGVALENETFGGGGNGETAEIDIFVQPQYVTDDYFNNSTSSFDSEFSLTIPNATATNQGYAERSTIRFGSSFMDDDGDVIDAELGLLTYRVDKNGEEFFGFYKNVTQLEPSRTMVEFFMDSDNFGGIRTDRYYVDEKLVLGLNENNLNRLVSYGRSSDDPSINEFLPEEIFATGTPGTSTTVTVSTTEDLEAGMSVCVMGADRECDPSVDEIFTINTVTDETTLQVTRNTNSVGAVNLAATDSLGYYPASFTDNSNISLTASDNYIAGDTSITVSSTSSLLEDMVICLVGADGRCDIGSDELIRVDDINPLNEIEVTRGHFNTSAQSITSGDSLVSVAYIYDGRYSFFVENGSVSSEGLTPATLEYGELYTTNVGYDDDDIVIEVEETAGVYPGVVLCVVDDTVCDDGDEQLSIVSVDSGASTVTVTRGFNGTTPAPIEERDPLKIVGGFDDLQTVLRLDTNIAAPGDIFCNAGSDGVCEYTTADEILEISSIDYGAGTVTVNRSFGSVAADDINPFDELTVIPRFVSGAGTLEVTEVDNSASPIAAVATSVPVVSAVNLNVGNVLCVDIAADDNCDVNDEQLRILSITQGATPADVDTLTVQRAYNSTIATSIPDETKLLTIGSVVDGRIIEPDGYLDFLEFKTSNNELVYKFSANEAGEAGPPMMQLSSMLYPARIAGQSVSDQSAIGLAVRNFSGSDVLSTTDHFGGFAVGGVLYPALQTGGSKVGRTDHYRYQAQVDAGLAYDGTNIITNATGFTGGAGLDFAETFPSEEELEPGEIVQFANKAENVERSTKQPYSKRLAGIVSTAPGFLAGGNYKEDYPVALVGRVPTKVTTENGAINIGDAITASATKNGFGMKATQDGYIVGYALESLTEGEEGEVVVFVRPGFYSAEESLTQLEATGELNVSLQSLTNVASVHGIRDQWMIAENGDFTTSGKITQLLKGINQVDYRAYPVFSPAELVQAVGSVRLTDGRAHVKFNETYPELQNLLRRGGDYQVFVTANDSTPLHVSRKDDTGFIIRDSGVNSSTTVDWMIVGKLHSYEDADLIEEEEATAAVDSSSSNVEEDFEELSDEVLVEDPEEVIDESSTEVEGLAEEEEVSNDSENDEVNNVLGAGDQEEVVDEVAQEDFVADEFVEDPVEEDVAEVQEPVDVVEDVVVEDQIPEDLVESPEEVIEKEQATEILNDDNEGSGESEEILEE